MLSVEWTDAKLGISLQTTLYDGNEMETHEAITIRVARPVITVLEGGWIRGRDLAMLTGRAVGTINNWRHKRIGPKPKKIGTQQFYSYDDALRRIANGTLLEPWDKAA